MRLSSRVPSRLHSTSFRKILWNLEVDILVIKIFVSLCNFTVSVDCREACQSISHYGDVILGVIASQITSLTIVYSTINSDTDQRKHHSRVTGLSVGNSPGTGEFPAKMASNAESISIWWRHHAERLTDSYANVALSSLCRILWYYEVMTETSLYLSQILLQMIVIIWTH